MASDCLWVSQRIYSKVLIHSVKTMNVAIVSNKWLNHSLKLCWQNILKNKIIQLFFFLFSKLMVKVNILYS